jgi:hypothetical protein
MNKFEQLIEYVINDEDAKARELFHDIVVEKSRQIYEEMMEEDAITEESTEDEDEKAEKAGEKVTKDIEYDDKRDRKEKKMHEAQDDLGGDQADDLIDDIEVEEEGISMEAEDDDMDDMDSGEDLEDRVVDLEDKLDELMAEFEAMMGGEGQEDEMDMEVDMDMDTPDMDAEEVVDDEMETEGMMRMSMEEAVELKAAPKPVTAEEGSVNKKAVYAVDSGARGAVAKPTNLDQGGEAKGRPAPKAQDMGMTMQPDVKPATKPHLAQATGVNVKSPLPGQ